jgi:hypothetical protein
VAVALGCKEDGWGTAGTTSFYHRVAKQLDSMGCQLQEVLALTVVGSANHTAVRKLSAALRPCLCCGFGGPAVSGQCSDPFEFLHSYCAHALQATRAARM